MTLALWRRDRWQRAGESLFDDRCGAAAQPAAQPGLGLQALGCRPAVDHPPHNDPTHPGRLTVRRRRGGRGAPLQGTRVRVLETHTRFMQPENAGLMLAKSVETRAHKIAHIIEKLPAHFRFSLLSSAPRSLIRK